MRPVALGHIAININNAIITVDHTFGHIEPYAFTNTIVKCMIIHLPEGGDVGKVIGSVDGVVGVVVGDVIGAIA